MSNKKDSNSCFMTFLALLEDIIIKEQYNAKVFLKVPLVPYEFCEVKYPPLRILNKQIQELGYKSQLYIAKKQNQKSFSNLRSIINTQIEWIKFIKNYLLS